MTFLRKNKNKKNSLSSDFQFDRLTCSVFTAVKYMSTVTEFGCIPVTTLFHSCRDGWRITRLVPEALEALKGFTF